jgi:hypothetical protein
MPRGLRPCRSGGASSAALRPACACDRAGQIDGRSLAVPRRRVAPAGSAYPPAALAARDPHAPAPSAYARWAVLATTLAPSRDPAVLVRLRQDVRLQHDLRVVGGGHSSRPSGEAAIAPEAAGPQRAHRRRETLVLSAAKDTARDPAAGRAAGSRPEELRAAASGGEQGPNAASSEGQARDLHAVESKAERPGRSSRGETIKSRAVKSTHLRKRPGRDPWAKQESLAQ